jgi:hypothetical protein
MFDHDLIEKHSFDSIPLDRELYLMDEKWMPAYDKALITLLGGGEYDNIYKIGYVSYAVPREIRTETVELSWYPNIYDRFHEVRVILPRAKFVACIECSQDGGDPRIFVRSDWLTNLHLRAYSVFVFIDAIGMKAALKNGTLTRPRLVALRDKIDEISARYPAVSFISFADSLLLKSNWFVGQWNSEISYTYEPETIIRLLPEINSAYLDVLGMATYAVITQGSNEYYDDGLLHISTARNHVSLNSLGLPFAQLLAIDCATRKGIHDGVHARAEVYMDEILFRSLLLEHNFSKGSPPKHAYTEPMTTGPSYYRLESRQTLLDNLRSFEERK